MYNTRNEYILACNYLVCVDDIIMGFSKIGNLTMTLDTETFKEGGNEASPRVVKKKENDNKILTLEKGISRGLEDAVLWFLTPGCQIDNITILIKRNLSEIEKVFYIEHGTVTKVSYSNLDAVSSSILVATLEISHSGIKELDM